MGWAKGMGNVEPRRPAFLVPLFPVAGDDEKIIIVTTGKIRRMGNQLPALFWALR